MQKNTLFVQFNADRAQKWTRSAFFRASSSVASLFVLSLVLIGSMYGCAHMQGSAPAMGQFAKGSSPDIPSPHSTPAASDSAAQSATESVTTGPTLAFPAQGFTMEVSAAPDLEVTIRGTPLARERVDHVRSIIEAQLKVYPPGVLDESIKTVILFDTLTVNTQAVSGTYIPGIVFIGTAAYPQAGHMQDMYVARTLHHEVSSFMLFMHRPKFDEGAFRSINGPTFTYVDEVPGADPAISIKRVYTAADSTPLLTDFAEGFVVPYAKWNIEQDFNSYAEVLLWRPELLLDTFAPNSKVGKKARIVCDLYIAINPAFAAHFTRKSVK